MLKPKQQSLVSFYVAAICIFLLACIYVMPDYHASIAPLTLSLAVLGAMVASLRPDISLFRNQIKQEPIY